MGKDTDRDILEKITDLISECKTLLETINDNKYVPHIITQPVDYTGAIGDTATFTVVANNVKSYNWQVRVGSQTTWNNTSSGTGYNTNSWNIGITSVRLANSFRCKITGLDDSVIYSDIVKMVIPET